MTLKLITLLHIALQFISQLVNSQLMNQQYLGCFFESINLKKKELAGLFLSANADVDQCSRYCYILNRVTFGITDQGTCICSNSNYDIFGAYDTYLCHNPCMGNFNYPGFNCGGNFIYVSFFRTCPPFTYGFSCSQFCFCRSSICQPINGICMSKGCLDGYKDTSLTDDYSICFTKSHKK